MEILVLIIELAKWLIVAAAVVFAVIKVLKAKMHNESLKRSFKKQQEVDKGLFPLKVQAVERLVLFLERLKPEHLMLRTASASNTPRDLQVKLLRTIREEFEHNLTQQIYVSQTSWELVRAAKEDMVKVINQEGDKISEEMVSSQFASMVLESCLKSDANIIERAISSLKAEVKE